MKRHVVIVGAGIVGASIAFHLSRLGMKITVVDCRWPAAGASGASDGMVSIATKLQGQQMEMAVRGKAYYAELARPSELLHDIYHERPTYILATNDTEVDFLHTHAENLRQVDVRVQMLEGPALEAALPGLRQNNRPVLKTMNEGHVLGYQVTKALLKSSNAKIRRCTPVTGLDIAANCGRCIGVRANGEVISADDVVVAAGPATGNLIAGIDIRPQRGLLIVTDRSKTAQRFPGTLFFATYMAVKAGLITQDQMQDLSPAGSALVIDPLRTGQFLIGSTREPGDDSRHTEFATVRHILRQAIKYVRGLADLDVIRVFAGIRANTLDGLPIIGPVSDTPGLWVATGFGSDGIALAPLAGRELGKLMVGDKALPEFRRFSPGRFGAPGAAV